MCIQFKGSSEDDDPSADYPPLLRTTSSETLSAVVLHFANLLQKLAMIELGLEKKELKGKKSDKKDAQFDGFVKSAIAIIEWFARLCSSFGDGMKRECLNALQLAVLKQLFF
jgi:hypothetical protein